MNQRGGKTQANEGTERHKSQPLAGLRTPVTSVDATLGHRRRPYVGTAAGPLWAGGARHQFR
jgi:hypothetical protein